MFVFDTLAQGVRKDFQYDSGHVLHGKLFVDHQAVHRRKNLRQKVTKLHYSALDVADSLPLVG
jgi:hypothetical protein